MLEEKKWKHYGKELFPDNTSHNGQLSERDMSIARS